MGTTTTRLTVDDYLALPEEKIARTELIDGEIVEMSGARFGHEWIKSRVLKALFAWAGAHPGYEVFAETTYKWSESDTLRPAVSVLAEQQALTLPQVLVASGAPLVAVEVVPSDEAVFLETKVQLYLRYGSAEVWVIYPEAVYVHRIDGVARLSVEDTLKSDALPGFTIPVSRLFPEARKN